MPDCWAADVNTGSVNPVQCWSAVEYGKAGFGEEVEFLFSILDGFSK